MKKRILILEQQSFRGGAQGILRMVLSSLDGDIDPIIAFPGRGPFELEMRAQEIQTLLYPLGSYRAGRKSLADLAAFGPRSALCALRLAATIFRHNIDLVFINGPRCLLTGVITARLTGRPALFCLHNTLSHRAELALASRLVGWCSRTVTCSQAAAAPLLRANPDLRPKLDVLYPPIDDCPLSRVAEARRASRQASSLVVGMVGRITEEKGHRVLLEALVNLGPAKGRRGVIVGGPAPDNAQDQRFLHSLREFAAEHRLAEDVTWAGVQADPGPWYDQIDVLVVPSIGEEGLGVVILEAAQRGIPVVASRVGGIPEFIKDGVNGMLVQPGDPRELARSIGQLQSDPELCNRLGAAARAAVDERFSRTNYCSTIREIIFELCSARAQPTTTPVWGESRR